MKHKFFIGSCADANFSAVGNLFIGTAARQTAEAYEILMDDGTWLECHDIMVVDKLRSPLFSDLTT